MYIKAKIKTKKLRVQLNSLVRRCPFDEKYHLRES